MFNSLGGLDVFRMTRCILGKPKKNKKLKYVNHHDHLKVFYNSKGRDFIEK